MAPAFPIVYTGQKESKNSMTMMSKKKFPMGHTPGGLMPDYRHAVETMAESEGFGSSGRVDTDMTLSDDSCSPKRKCISLNGDSHDRFGVPVQVLSFSKMSKSERKDLELRLRRELEEVRILQSRVASFNPSAVILSPTSDIRSCSDGKKRPPLERNPKPSEHPSQGKKRLPPGQNGSRKKKGLVGHAEPHKQAVPINTSNAMLMKQCENLLGRLMSHQLGWVFNQPVDVVALKIPDYFTVIKHPMDLGTVKSKLARGEYSSPAGFAADVRLTFSNAMTYNPHGNDVHFMAQTLSKHFEQRWKVIEKKMTTTKSQLLLSRKDTQVHKAPVNDQIPSSKKKNSAPAVYIGKSEPIKKVMTDQDKHKLSIELEALLGEYPENIIDFLKENSSADGQTGEDEIEIDIDALGDDVLFKLRKLVDDYLLDKKQTKGEQCEMELHNESGFSNSSIQPGKGNDGVDEDVDIGGTELPVSSFPPIEIEKDTTHKNDRVNCHSSSSSGAGSSSSDSDSDSAHTIEPDGIKSLQEGHTLPGTVNDGPNLEQNVGNTELNGGRKQSQNTSNEVEQNVLTKRLSVEVDDLKDGESAPSESQVSPDKLYRAALLRSRFADTILKAQEKTLEKGEKCDPEKLRLEREELERRLREEKARLQAEAKAAEEARRKAEFEAAAEAKRKRELEREAARLALQKMEKTVEINENCQFMEDLELLRAAPTEDLMNLMDEDVTPDDASPDARLGSFRLRGNNNPLEQLGLFMKDDDEEEEEIEGPPSALEPGLNDVEEGEI